MSPEPDNDNSLLFIDLCHEYGASSAPESVTFLDPNTKGERDSVSQAVEQLGFADFFARRAPYRGELVLYACLKKVALEVNGSVRHGLVRWFQFYGILEIAIESGAIPEKLPDQFASLSLKEVSSARPDFWADLGLPLLSEFLRRLQGFGIREAAPAASKQKMFSLFLGLNFAFQSDTSISYIFDMTQEEDAEFFGQVDQLLSSPITFTQKLTQPLANLSHVERVVLGTTRSIVLVRDLINLLEEMHTDVPILADSLRSYFRYWTDIIGSWTGMRITVKLLDAFELWAREANDEDALAQVIALREDILEFAEQGVTETA